MKIIPLFSSEKLIVSTMGKYAYHFIVIFLMNISMEPHKYIQDSHMALDRSPYSWLMKRSCLKLMSFKGSSMVVSKVDR